MSNPFGRAVLRRLVALYEVALQQFARLRTVSEFPAHTGPDVRVYKQDKNRIE